MAKTTMLKLRREVKDGFYTAINRRMYLIEEKIAWNEKTTSPYNKKMERLASIIKKDAEKYIHQVQKRRHLKGRKILDKTKTPVNRKHYQNKTVASPTKNLFGIQNMFVDEANSSDNYEESDNEKDYYWSDFENN